MYRLYVGGKQATEIARTCASGQAGVPAFEIPSRSVQEIVTTIARQRGGTPSSDLPELDEEGRLRVLFRRTIEQQEALATQGEADPKALTELAKGLKILNGTPKRNGWTLNGRPRTRGKTPPNLTEQLKSALARSDST